MKKSIEASWDTWLSRDVAMNSADREYIDAMLRADKFLPPPEERASDCATPENDFPEEI